MPNLQHLQFPSHSRWSSSRRGRWMADCKTLGEALNATHDFLDMISHENVAAFWAVVPQLLQKHNVRRRGGQKHEKMSHQFDDILTKTMEDIETFGPRELATTTLGLAKIVKDVESSGMRLIKGSPHQSLHDLLVGGDKGNKQFIFRHIACASMPVLHNFDARCLSNFVYAHAVANYVPTFEDGSSFFDIVAKETIPKLGEFNPQDFSNLLWSYATTEETNSALFEEVGDAIVALAGLDEFESQGLSNTLWSYATLGQSHPSLFKKVAVHMDALNNLESFYPQALSNITWAYATAKEPYPQLFKKIAGHVVTQKYLTEFKPQALSNIAWGFATAKESHPELFKIIADHIIGLSNLNEFKPGELSDLVWAYATVTDSQEPHHNLFKKVTGAAIKRQTEFSSEEIANLLWACASSGQVDQNLFTSLEPTIGALINKCNSQEIATIAWAYAVAKVSAPSLFSDDFISICLEIEDEFTPGELSQLHQWQLWQDELETNVKLPTLLQDKCHAASASALPSPSALEEDGVSEPSSTERQLEEEELKISNL